MFKIEINKEVHLELTHPTHAKDTFALTQKNKALFRQWLLWVDKIKSVDDTMKFIDSSLQRYADKKYVNCMIFYKNQLVGNVELAVTKGYGIKKGEVGYWLDADFHGKGIIHKAVKKMVKIGFKEYGLDKIFLRCAVQNERSCNVAKKLGFTHEGRHREEIVVNDRVMDIDVYAILKHEFV
ncbi:MAG: GNAT family N-acetyltransferase [Epsilonproteobacteria bacterium]|nr:GNAT family N-acetyltransferase [Campylobacterota bacterium]